MSNQAIFVEKVTKFFDTKPALNDISFDVKKGEIFGFLGPSGSGKTTTINILTGQLKVDSGFAKMFGNNVDNLTIELLKKVGIVSDQSGYYEKLTLYKNLELFAKIHGKKNKDIDTLLKKVDLYHDKNKLVESLSTGMKQRMLLVRALINEPKIIFLDEPTSGLDPYTSKKIHELLITVKEKGTTIFLTTHDMNEATLLCNNLVLLHKGTIVECGNPKEIIQKYNTKKEVKITYRNQQTEILPFHLLNTLDLNQVISLHSCEPTLADIFIKLTGEKLYEQN